MSGRWIHHLLLLALLCAAAQGYGSGKKATDAGKSSPLSIAASEGECEKEEAGQFNVLLSGPVQIVRLEVCPAVVEVFQPAGHFSCAMGSSLCRAPPVRV